MPQSSINRRRINRPVNRKNQPQDTAKQIVNQPPDTETGKDTKKRIYIYLVIIIGLTLLAYLPTFKNTFTNWDDGKYTVENPLIKPLNAETVKEMFFSKALYKRYWMGNYHPLTMLSLSINYALAKKDADGKPSPFGFQLVNILLHLLNTLLVFLIIRLLFRNNEIAFFTALLFGVHTLHVESVAWIAERKDVLYTFFYLSAFYVYSLYAKTLKWGHYILAFLLFLLSLLSKGQATTLAVAIILVDYVYKRKLLSGRVILEKIPFLILSLIFGLIAIEAQKQGNALQVVNSNPIVQRIGVALYGFTMYILKLILPVHLSAVYPYPDIINHTLPFYYWLGSLTVIAVTFIFVKAYKEKKDFLVFGIGFFVINIILLLQLIPVGSAVYADRYVYIPSIGYFLIVSWLVYKTKLSEKQKFIIIGIYSILLTFLTIQRIPDWRDSRTLWEDVTAKEPLSVVAWNNLGSEYNRISVDYKEKGDIENFKEYKQKAIECFTRGIKRKPDYKSAFYNRGFAKFELGKFNNDTAMVMSALADMNSAITIDVAFADAYGQRASIYDWLGQYKNALNDYDYALQLQPKNTQLLVNRGTTKGKSGDLQGAIADFNKALELDPQVAGAYENRGLAYFYLNQYDKALADYNKALSIKPEGNTYYNRGLLFYTQKKYSEALDDFKNAEKLNFVLPQLYYYKALCEENLSLFDDACKDAQTAVNQGIKNASIIVQKYCK